MIRLLQRQVMASEETLCIDVRCDYVLTDALREARKKKFDPRKPIKVLIIVTGFGKTLRKGSARDSRNARF